MGLTSHYPGNGRWGQVCIEAVLYEVSLSTTAALDLRFSRERRRRARRVRLRTKDVGGFVVALGEFRLGDECDAGEGDDDADALIPAETFVEENRGEDYGKDDLDAAVHRREHTFDSSDGPGVEAVGDDGAGEAGEDDGAPGGGRNAGEIRRLEGWNGNQRHAHRGDDGGVEEKSQRVRPSLGREPEEYGVHRVRVGLTEQEQDVYDGYASGVKNLIRSQRRHRPAKHNKHAQHLHPSKLF